MNSQSLLSAHLDHRRFYDNFDYVYPVISRRAQGVSIGINLNPDKTCNFDCIYCEVDHATSPRRRDVDVLVVAQELRDMLKIVQEGTLFSREPFAATPPEWRGLKVIAFSGDGEPTTCPIFDQVVEAVWHVRDSMGLIPVKLVLITNSSCLERPGVRRGIRRMSEGPHEIWAKLDAGTEEYYQMINRTDVPFARILENITETASWCPVIIQTLFVRISGKLPPVTEIFAYTDRLNEIRAAGGKILALQLYTMARPAASTLATPLTYEEMNHIAAIVQERTGLPHLLFYGNAPEVE